MKTTYVFLPKVFQHSTIKNQGAKGRGRSVLNYLPVALTVLATK